MGERKEKNTKIKLPVLQARKRRADSLPRLPGSHHSPFWINDTCSSHRDHFRVVFCLDVKTSLRAKPFTWNVFPCTFIFMQIKLVFIWKVFHEDSSWNIGKWQLGNGLLPRSHKGVEGSKPSRNYLLFKNDTDISRRTTFSPTTLYANTVYPKFQQLQLLQSPLPSGSKLVLQSRLMA